MNVACTHEGYFSLYLSQMLHEKFVEYFISTNKIITLLKNNTIHSKNIQKTFHMSQILDIFDSFYI